MVHNGRRTILRETGRSKIRKFDQRTKRASGLSVRKVSLAEADLETLDRRVESACTHRAFQPLVDPPERQGSVFWSGLSDRQRKRNREWK